MPESAPHVVKRGAAFHSEGREAVPQIVQPHIRNARQHANLVPGAIDADERLIAYRRREDVLAALFHSLQDLKRRLRERYGA